MYLLSSWYGDPLRFLPSLFLIQCCGGQLFHCSVFERAHCVHFPSWASEQVDQPARQAMLLKILTVQILRTIIHRSWPRGPVHRQLSHSSVSQCISVLWSACWHCTGTSCGNDDMDVAENTKTAGDHHASATVFFFQKSSETPHEVKSHTLHDSFYFMFSLTLRWLSFLFISLRLPPINWSGSRLGTSFWAPVQVLNKN